jgi:hypothetical protein
VREALPGTEKTIRGFSGAALLIVDEAARVDDALYYAVKPMLAVSGGSLLMLSTPYGRRGEFLRDHSPSRRKHDTREPSSAHISYSRSLEQR